MHQEVLVETKAAGSNRPVRLIREAAVVAAEKEAVVLLAVPV
jgi:hypothetical protein